MLQDADALPQLIGDYKPVDQWQAHINQLFYRFRGDQIRNYYQTFASADYRLAHALAADYYERVRKRFRRHVPCPHPDPRCGTLGGASITLPAGHRAKLAPARRTERLLPASATRVA